MTIDPLRPDGENTPTTTEPRATPPAAGTSKQAAARPPVRLRRVLAVVAPIALVAIGIAVFYGMFEGDKIVSDFLKPPVVPARGQVFWNEQPLAGAEVKFTPVESGLMAAIGATDDEGRFELKTDIDGTYREGTYAGKHRVSVGQYRVNPGASPPSLVTPSQYASFAATPLRASVSRSSQENVFRFELEGSPPEDSPRVSGPGGGGPGGGGRGRGAQGQEAGPRDAQ